MENTINIKASLDTMWMLLMALLVFFMNCGFAMLETGFCRAKNVVNLLSKNICLFFISTLAFWSIGFSIMFTASDNDYFSSNFLKGVFLSGNYDIYSALKNNGIPLEAIFFFQLVLAGTATNIISGAIAERVKFFSFLAFAFIASSLIYPVCGHWISGKGFLYILGVRDFAGSLMIHTLGGMSALAGVIVLGPRVGKYNKDLSSNAILGHSVPMITLGGFILWLGWFGFNMGCAYGFSPICAHIALCTNASAIMGGIGALIVSMIMQRKPDLSMIINGLLGGLVASTASCAYINLTSAHIIGFIAGCLVVVSVLSMDKVFHIDDPVGAISVHAICGIWGSIALGLFSLGDPLMFSSVSPPKAGLFFGGSYEQLLNQLIGVLVVIIWSFSTSFIVWFLLKKTIGIRISQKVEVDGLDIGEHGMEAYPGFVSSSDNIL